jgi:hypothetical protein
MSRTLRLFASVCSVVSSLALGGCIIYGVDEAQPETSVKTASGQSVKKLMVWDGESGGNAGNWASCNKKGACQADLQSSGGAGRDDSTGLKFHAVGADWLGFGWNWFNWWPTTAGTDSTKFKNLTFWVKVETEKPELGPDKDSLKVVLAGSGADQKDVSDEVSIESVVPEFADGKWHEVVIPLDKFFVDKGKKFDRSRVWEFRIGHFGLTAKNFTVFVDEIGFDSR